jgi:hypothetical protein
VLRRDSRFLEMQSSLKYAQPKTSISKFAHLGCLNSNKKIDRNIPQYIYLQNPTYMDIISITEKISALTNIWNKL